MILRPSAARIVVTVFLLMLNTVRGAETINLVRNGTPNAAIILAKKATRSAQMGALELQHHIRLISGATLPICIENASLPVKIHIGDSMAARAAGLRPEMFSGESYQIKTVGNNIYLTGSDSPDFAPVDYSRNLTFPRTYFTTLGSLYAVYDFLEERCGVLFCGPWENATALPHSKNISIAPFNKKFTPPLSAFREIYTDDHGYTTQPFSERERMLWKLRWRMSEHYGKATHNTYTLYFQYWDKANTPQLAGEFKRKRPELFAAGYQGSSSYADPAVRLRYPNDPDLPPQPCFTHPDTISHFADVAATYYHGHNVPGGWWNNTGKAKPQVNLTPRTPGMPFFYPVEPGDSNLFCKCANCTGLFPELQGNLKTSNLKFRFIAEIAKAAGRNCPGAGISSLAYIQTLPYPNKVKLPPNVSVELCLTNFAWWHPGIRQAQEKEYRLWMKNEAKKRPITLWTYIYSPHWDARRHYHYHNFPGLYPWKTGAMTKQFAEDGIKGWFAEIELQHSLAEAYVAARIAFDPSLDVHHVVDRWLRAGYGKAAPFMKEIYKISEDAWWNPRNYPQEWFADPAQPLGPRGPHNPYWGTALHSEAVNWSIGTPERFNRIEALLAQAAKQVATPSEKAALQRFIQGIWSIARKGRIEYDLKQANQGKKQQKNSTPASIASAGGDPRKVNWAEAVSTGEWVQNRNGEKHPRKITLRTAVDHEYLYLKYDENHPAGKSGGGAAYWRNCVELFFAELPYPPVWQIGIAPDGRLQQLKYSLQNDAVNDEKCDLHPRFYNHNDGKSWHWLMAIPLKNLPVGKNRVGLTANFFRTFSTGEPAASWSPLFFVEAYRNGLADYGRLHFPKIEYRDANFLAPHETAVDPAALDGKSAAMDGNKGWTLRCPLGVIAKGTYDVNIRMRTDAPAEAGLTSRVGFYDTANKKIAMVRPIPVVEISGDTYKTVRIGPVVLSPDMYFYVGGFNRKGVSPSRVLIDRITLEKENIRLKGN